MKKPILLLLSFFVLVTAGCGEKNAGKEKISGKLIQNLVSRAIAGSTSANDSLGGLVNRQYPVDRNYNNLKIDSLKSKTGFLYYTILLEYPNPAYNRFAVYDTLLQAHLIDKSLNGNISEDKIFTDGLSFIKLSEYFISKDIFNVQRISLYSIDDSTVSRVFRTFTKLAYGNREYTQALDEISAQRIKTSMTSNRYSAIKNKSDIFMFEPEANFYKSSSDLFDKYITGIINRSKNKIKNPEIIDEKSIWESLGIDPQAQINKAHVNSNSESGYSLNLSEDWKVFKDFNVAEYLNKEFNGTRFLNNSIGTSISVFEIPVTKSAEDFIKFKLDKSITKGNLVMRYTDEIIDGKLFVRFYEFYCENKKMVVMIKGSKYTYEDYKELYSRIINSFSMEC
jgi:hypothetical protein